jgi:hypothetical protein
MWMFFRPDVPIMRIEASILVSRKSIHQKKKKSEKQNLGCFLLDLKAMWHPIWQGNLLAANVTHAYNDTDVVFQSSSLDVQKKFSKYLIPVQLL